MNEQRRSKILSVSNYPSKEVFDSRLVSESRILARRSVLHIHALHSITTSVTVQVQDNNRLPSIIIDIIEESLLLLLLSVVMMPTNGEPSTFLSLCVFVYFRSTGQSETREYESQDQVHELNSDTGILPPLLLQIGSGIGGGLAVMLPMTRGQSARRPRRGHQHRSSEVVRSSGITGESEREVKWCNQGHLKHTTVRPQSYTVTTSLLQAKAELPELS